MALVDDANPNTIRNAFDFLQRQAQQYSNDEKTRVAAGCFVWNVLIWGVNKIECYIPPASIKRRDGLYYNLVTHAEIDLCRQIDKGDLKGKTLYTTLFPCDDCVKVLLDWGLDTKIITLEDRPEMHWCQRSKELLKQNGIEWEIFKETERQ